MRSAFTSGIDWRSVDAVIFDVDGTLFDHLALRRPMMARLLAALCTFRMSPRDLMALQVFRKERDRLAFIEAEDIGRAQFERVAEKLGRRSGEIEAIATRWMCEEPLPLVPRYAFPGTGPLIAALQDRGIRVGVFSDYPTEGKLRALGLEVELAVDAGHPQIGRLKPHPAGFLHVAAKLGAEPARSLIIGDRDDRDIEAARRGGFLSLRKASPGAEPAPGSFAHYADLLAEVQSLAPPPETTTGGQTSHGWNRSLPVRPPG